MEGSMRTCSAEFRAIVIGVKSASSVFLPFKRREERKRSEASVEGPSCTSNGQHMRAHPVSISGTLCRSTTCSRLQLAWSLFESPLEVYQTYLRGKVLDAEGSRQRGPDTVEVYRV